MKFRKKPKSHTGIETSLIHVDPRAFHRHPTTHVVKCEEKKWFLYLWMHASTHTARSWDKYTFYVEFGRLRSTSFRWKPFCHFIHIHVKATRDMSKQLRRIRVRICTKHRIQILLLYFYTDSFGFIAVNFYHSVNRFSGVQNVNICATIDFKLWTDGTHIC